MNRVIKIFNCIFPGLLFLSSAACTKLTQVGEPVNTITNEETFSNDATATSAVIGIYNDMVTPANFLGNGWYTINLGMAADELKKFGGSSRFETNNLAASRGDSDPFWNSAYFEIYLANAIIENLPGSSGVSSLVKTQLTGEAKFLRAFLYFYLVNLYGDVPYANSTAYRISDTLHRSPAAQVYSLIIDDLKDAENRLAEDYSFIDGYRIRANKYAAAALLARVYLYQEKWEDAENESTAVINNTGLYQLATDINAVFLAGSSEAILQLEAPDIYPWSVREAVNLIPNNNTSYPSYYIREELLAAFEPDDLRRSNWIDSTNAGGNFYYYPYKYKVRVGSSGNITESITLLRLGEQYLIRAEARAWQNKLTEAIDDINLLRSRANLLPLPPDLNQQDLLDAIARERRVELFAELGHRWLDLKRTGQADAVLGSLKPSTWKPTSKLFPVPASELVNDPNLAQNPGY